MNTPLPQLGDLLHDAVDDIEPADRIEAIRARTASSPTRAARPWAYAAGGVVAQTTICTHAACEVTDWMAESFHMQCPCHFSVFDPRQNGAVIQGPATRKLPALALSMDGDRIVVREPFDGRVGGDTA